MKRLLSYLALAVLGPIWRLPAWAQLTTLGVGGITAAAVVILTPPTTLPQPSAAFSQSNGWGVVNQALKPNGGTAGAFAFPPTPTDSFTVYHDLLIDPNLGGLAKWALGNNSATMGEAVSSTNPGAPVFSVQDNVLGPGAKGFNWWPATAGVQPLSSIGQLSLANKGANYNAGLYQWAATGGCPSPSSREPTGIMLTGSGGYAQIGDPGWLCGGTPTINFAAIPGVGASQTATAATCASATPSSGQIQVTVTLPIPHGIQAGQQFLLAGFTPSGWNGTYAAVAGTTGATLVGTNASSGTCPSMVTVEGTAVNGTGGGASGSITIATPSATNPYAAQYTTGVQTAPNQRVCGAFGELGTDSLFPGAPFAYYTDHLGNPLVNAPAVSPWLNQGVAIGINGYTAVGTQAPSSPALTVTSMTAFNITSATFDSSGLAHFTMTNPGLIVGSEFTVSGMTTTGAGTFNLTYVAVASGTDSAHIVANPLSRPIGLPATPALTTSSTGSGGSLISVIMPGMYVTGATGYSVISPFGAFGSTGVGGPGTYGLTATQANFTFNATIAGNTMTVIGTPTTQLVVGMGVTGSGVTANSVITGYGTGTGGAGTYTLSQSSTVSTSTSMTSSGSIGTLASPVQMYAAAPFYYSAIAPSASAPGGGTVTAHTQAQMGDILSAFGSQSVAPATQNGSNVGGWGGNLGNIGMFQGAPFPNTKGALSSSAMTDICTKTHAGAGQDLQTWAASAGGAWKSLYRLSDPGIWADSSGASFSGYVTGASGATAALNVVGSPVGTLGAGQVICGPGLAGGPAACPTLGGSTGAWTLTWGSSIAANLGTSGSPVAFSAGAFKPATPLGTSGFTATIAGSTLNVSAINTAATATSGSMAAGSSTMVAAAATGTIAQGQCFHDGGVQISEANPLCITGGTSPNWTVNSTYYPTGITATPSSGAGALTTSISAIVPGTWVQGAGVAQPVQIIGYGTGNGGVGTYTIANPNGISVASPAAMTSTGVSAGGAIAPGAALTIDNSGVGVTYPITNSGASTGTLKLSGGYSNALLHGDPKHIQVQVSSTPFGDPVTGCSACAWTNVSSETISGGQWSGSVVNIPSGGPYYLAVQASNGVGYATLPNAVFVGWSLAFFGEGNSAAQISNAYNSQGFFANLASAVGFQIGGIGGNNITNATFLPGPSVLGVSPSIVGQVLADRFAELPTSAGAFSDGGIGIVNGLSATSGSDKISLVNMGKNGTSFEALFYDDIPQTQTIGVGDGSTATFSSGPGYGGSAGSAAVNNITVTGITTSGVMTVTGNTVGAYGSGPGWSYLGVGQGVSGTGIPAGAFISGLGTGTGAGGTYIISPPPASGVGAETVTITHNNLEFNAALGYGAAINGQIFGSTLTVNSLTSGALSPGQALSDALGNITGSPTLLACLTHCGAAPVTNSITNSIWSLSASVGTVSAEAMTLTPPGGVLWATNQIQPPIIPVQTPGGTVGSAPVVKAGTFQVTVGGTVMCSDPGGGSVYNTQSGVCTGAGASGWVNYATGAYSVTFSSPPASSAPIVASYVNRMTFDNSNAYEQISTVGVAAKPQEGAFAAVAAKTGGIAAYVNGQQSFAGWPDTMLTWAHLNNRLFGTQMAALHNGAPNLPMLTTGQWRGTGPIAFYGLFSYGSDLDNEQWMQDAATPSSWSGTVVGSGSTAILTLSSAATGPMWEGEAIECNPPSTSCALPFGAEIVSLASGTWGANGSTYSLTVDAGESFSNISSALPMRNAMFYPPGAVYVGPYNDLAMQQGSPGIGNYGVETGGGIAGALRYGHRLGLISGAALSGHPEKATPPSLDRGLFTGCDSSATTSPCLATGNTYSAHATATWSGSLVTVTGGISAGDIPFTPGMAITCSGCNSNLVATSVSLPPTQSTTTGAGQVGQTFTIQVNGTVGGSGSGTITGGCSGTAGVGSNCMLFAIDINTTGTYATPAQLQTCGANNLVGTNVNSPPATTYLFPNGSCVPAGIGSLVRGFRIGTTQIMDVPFSPGSSVYDFGVDPNLTNGAILQDEAFSCFVVGKLTSPARGVVECVHGPNFASPAAPVLGTWAPLTTFASYGDPYANTSYTGGLMGNVGGQSFAFTAGSGYSVDGHYGLGGVCTLVSGGANVPKVPIMGIDIVGGKIVNAYPDFLGNGATTTCTFPLNISGSNATLSASSGLNATLNVSGTITGGTLGPNMVVQLGSQVLTLKPIAGGTINAGGVGSYAVTCAATCSNQLSALSWTSGPQGGSGGALSVIINPLEGRGGMATYDTDNNMMGMFLYDNTGATGNPLAGKFAIPQGGQEAPGLAVRPWGMRRGSQVSG